MDKKTFSRIEAAAWEKKGGKVRITINVPMPGRTGLHTEYTLVGKGAK